MDLTLLFSDLHLAGPGELVAGLDPWARLETALEVACRRHPDAIRAVILGDLTHRGEPVAYARLARRLDALPFPVSLIPGNHDRRAGFAAAFPGAVGDDGFAQAVVEAGDTVLILCDTLDEAAPDRHSGLICDTRLDWLRRALDATVGRQVVVMTHHPLFATGFEGMDAIALRNAAPVAAMLREAGVEMVISGHVHAAVSGISGGLPWAILPSTCHQMPMQLGPGTTTVSSQTAGGYGVLLSQGSGSVLHFATTEEAEVLDEPGSA